MKDADRKWCEQQQNAGVVHSARKAAALALVADHENRQLSAENAILRHQLAMRYAPPPIPDDDFDTPVPMGEFKFPSPPDKASKE